MKNDINGPIFFEAENILLFKEPLFLVFVGAGKGKFVRFSMTKTNETDQGLYIDYRLNLLGIRVGPEACQLISKDENQWQPIGPVVSLPVSIPSIQEIKERGTDPLRLTALQYFKQHPGSDLVEVLGRRKSFSAAISTHASEPAVVGALVKDILKT